MSYIILKNVFLSCLLVKGQKISKSISIYSQTIFVTINLSTPILHIFRELWSSIRLKRWKRMLLGKKRLQIFLKFLKWLESAIMKSAGRSCSLLLINTICQVFHKVVKSIITWQVSIWKYLTVVNLLKKSFKNTLERNYLNTLIILLQLWPKINLNNFCLVNSVKAKRQFMTSYNKRKNSYLFMTSVRFYLAKNRTM